MRACDRARRSRTRLLVLCVLAACESAPPAQAQRPLAFERVELSPRQVAARVWSKGPKHRFEGVSEGVQSTIASVVQRLWLGARAGQVPDRATIAAAAAQGMRIELWSVGGAQFAALLEAGPKVHGWGTYIVRIGGQSAAREVLLQAPHAFFDTHTGDIASALFFAAKGPHPRGLFVNNRQRYAGPGGQTPPLPHLSLDVCHNAEHPFTRATLAVLAVRPTIRVVQLHGFAAQPGDPEIIVSAGVEHHAPPYIVAARDRLRRSGWRAAAYPVDVRRLGATTNAQARASRRFATAEFVHVEMDAALRAALRTDPIAQGRLARAVLEP